MHRSKHGEGDVRAACRIARLRLDAALNPGSDPDFESDLDFESEL
jgi:hypothetical protein